jgi:hypothetical protein
MRRSHEMEGAHKGRKRGELLHDQASLQAIGFSPGRPGSEISAVPFGTFGGRMLSFAGAVRRATGACSKYSRMSRGEGSAMQLFGPPLSHCPACGSVALEPVVESDTDEVHFRCRDCMGCWHIELGRVRRMTPDLCHGCVHALHCVEAFGADRAPAR